MTQVSTPLFRVSRGCAAALLMLAAIQPVHALPVEFLAHARSVQVISGDATVFEDLQTGNAPVNVLVLGASALAGTGLLTASSSGSLVRTGDNNTIRATGSFAEAAVTWAGAGLDPVEAGVLARLSVAGSGSTEGSGNAQITLVASSSFGVSAQGLRFGAAGETRLFCDPVCINSGSPLVPASGAFLITGGRALELTVESRAAVDHTNSSSAPFNGTAAASASLSYTLEIIEDRRHWKLPGSGAVQADASWIEEAAPDASSWATFNSTAGRNLALALPGATTWRGLITDGETVNLDLAGHTLTLGSAGPSLKTYSIRVGEGRTRAAALTLRNGIVVADNDVVVGAVGGATSPTATLILDGGAVLTQRQGVGVAGIAVGDTGPGALVVRGGSRVFTNVLALASRAPLAPDTGLLRASLDINGADSRVEAFQVSLGARGDATATVRDGGFLQTQTLELAAQAGSKASLTVDGTRSLLRMTGGFVQIGAGGRATLEARNGGAIEGNSSFFTVGSGDPALFSVMRLTGPGTRLSEAGVQVNTGGLLEVRERADWAGPGNLLAVKGGQVSFRDATAKLSSLVVEGKFNGSSLVSTGLVDIEQGSFIDAAGADIFVNAGGRLTISGTSTRVTGFSDMIVEGTLAVNLGSVLEGDALGLSSSAVLLGTGTIKVNERFTVAGQLNPGNSPGLLRVEGNLTLTNTSRLTLEVAGTTAGSLHDVLQVTGNLELQGGLIELSFIDGFAPSAGDQFVLLSVGGSFANGATVGVSGLLPGWQFDAGFNATTGQLTLLSLSNGVSVVPEPAAWLLWCAGLVGWLARRRFA